MTAGLIGAITKLALRREVTVKPISETRSLATHSHPSKEKDLAIFCHRVALLAERVGKAANPIGLGGFWSLTVYNEEHLIEPNPLNRFSVGTKSKSMKQNSNGSLMLYFQNKSPGSDKESNWVSMPTDELSLYTRACRPEEQILNRSQLPPSANKIG
jgi:hypothetical protein